MVNLQGAGLIARAVCTVGLWNSLSICISNMFSGGVEANNVWSTLYRKPRIVNVYIGETCNCNVNIRGILLP